MWRWQKSLSNYWNMADSNRSFLSIFPIFLSRLKLILHPLMAMLTKCVMWIEIVNRRLQGGSVYCCMTLLRHLCVKAVKKCKNYFMKFIAKCGGGFAHIWGKHYLWTPNDDPIRFDFWRKKEVHAVCGVYGVKWRELNFIFKKLWAENYMFQYVFWH